MVEPKKSAQPGSVPETSCKRAFTDNFNHNNRVYRGKHTRIFTQWVFLFLTWLLSVLYRKRGDAQSGSWLEAPARKRGACGRLLSRRAPSSLLLWRILAESIHSWVSSPWTHRFRVIANEICLAFCLDKISFRNASHCSKNMPRSSKTWTYKSSYICRWSKVRTSSGLMIWVTCTDQVASQTPVEASQLSAEAHRWMELRMLEYQLISMLLETQLVRLWSAKTGRIRTCKACMIGLWAKRMIIVKARWERISKQVFLKSKHRPWEALSSITQRSTNRFVIGTSLETNLVSLLPKSTKRTSCQQIKPNRKAQLKMMPSLSMKLAIMLSERKTSKTI